VESAVVNSLRERFHVDPNGENYEAPTDLDLIERYATKIVMQSGAIEIHVAQRRESENSPPGRLSRRGQDEHNSQRILIVPWSTPAGPAAKGVLHSPTPKNENVSARSETLAAGHRKSPSLDRGPRLGTCGLVRRNREA